MRKRVPARQAMALMALFGCASAVWAGVVCDNDINLCPSEGWNCVVAEYGHCGIMGSWCQAGACGYVIVWGIPIPLNAYRHFRDHKWKMCTKGEELVWCSSCRDCTYDEEEEVTLRCCTGPQDYDPGCPIGNCD